MSNEAEAAETDVATDVEEIFATNKENDDTSIVEETLQVIAESENKDGSTTATDAEIGDTASATGENEEADDKSLDGKQVLIVAAQNSEDSIINMSSEGKQFLIVAQDSIPLNVGPLEEFKAGMAGEPATKQFKIQGQDGQSYVLTVAADNQGGSVIEPGQKRGMSANKGLEKKNQLLQSDVSQAWFTTRDDKNMLQNSGATWKQGQWTKDEVNLLQINISDYCKENGISDPTEIIFEMSKDERKQFYRKVAKGLQRPLFSVYRRVIRMYDQKNHIGKYSPEEMVKLRELKRKHGNDWAMIGQALGRSASSVKDKCRLMKDTCNSGKWLPDEERRLTDAVYEFSGAQPGENVVQGLSWSAVAEKVITRSEKQCRTKWLNYLNWKQKGGTDWTREDDMNLIMRVVNLGLSSDTEIDWNELSKDWKRSNIMYTHLVPHHKWTVLCRDLDRQRSVIRNCIMLEVQFCVRKLMVDGGIFYSVRSPQWLRGKWWSLKRHIPDYQLLPFNQLLECMKTFYLNIRVRPVTGSRSMKAEPATEQSMAYIPITLTGLQMDNVLEEAVPAVQAYEVLHQLPEASGSFVIAQPNVNSSAARSGFSEHIIVQTVPVSQQTSDDDVHVQSSVVITSPSGSDSLSGSIDLNATITLTQGHTLHDFIKENVISQTDSLSEDNSTFDTTTLVEQDMSESNDVMNMKSETESPVLLAPTFVPSSSSDAELMTSFSDPMLNSDSNSMMETTMDSDKNNDMIVNIE